MKITTNLSQEQYDKLKLFLISNFNIRFLHPEMSNVIESFEIIANDEKILGNFNDKQLLELIHTGTSQLSYKKLIDELKKINGTITNQNLDSFDNVDILLEHISNCDNCKSKLSDILNHINH